MWREAKKEVAKAKSNAYDELYDELDTKEGEHTLYRLARHIHQAGKDVQQVRMMKDKKWKRNDRRGERIKNMDEILHGADE